MSPTRNKKDIQKSLRAPFKVVTSHLKNLSADQTSMLEESVLADLVGDKPIRPEPYKRLSKAATHLTYAILHLHSSIGRFATYRKMFGHYPWRGRISKSEHILAVYHLFAHECYILEERLKGFFRSIENFGKEQRIEINLKVITKCIIKLHAEAFGSAVRARGVHVHQDDFARYR